MVDNGNGSVIVRAAVFVTFGGHDRQLAIFRAGLAARHRRVDEGHAFLQDVSATWTGLNSFMVTHNWWHQALYTLEAGRPLQALDVYDALFSGEPVSFWPRALSAMIADLLMFSTVMILPFTCGARVATQRTVNFD